MRTASLLFVLAIVAPLAACSSSSGHPAPAPPAEAGADDASDASEAASTTCADGVKDGDETDVDCGGSCASCAEGKHCDKATDCADGNCASGVCTPPSCTDKVKDGNETDVDCGGPNCGPCDNGKGCLTNENCKSLVCKSGSCQTPTCTDGVKNGTESDVDCGGNCGKCTVGRRCGAQPDCGSNICNGGICSCPNGMIIMPTGAMGGGSYCIDAHEVTSSDYNQFWTAAVDPATQPTYCRWNANFTPIANWPPSAGDVVPVRNVNWCDAYAYCKWNNKALCGKIAGGPNAPADLANPLASAWYNACSAQGTSPFPGGSAFDPSKCNGGPPPAMSTRDVWSTGTTSCQGGATGLYDMSGNVQEWEDSCSGTTGETDLCQARGGAFDTADTTKLRCDAPTALARNTQAADLGFRCCAFY